jgi:hypothetical protein
MSPGEATVRSSEIAPALALTFVSKFKLLLFPAGDVPSRLSLWVSETAEGNWLPAFAISRYTRINF